MMRQGSWGVVAALVAPLVWSSVAIAQQPAEGGDTPPTGGDAPAGGDMSADAGAGEEGLGEEDPARPPPAGKGVVWGVVTDAATKEPIFDAQVAVVGAPSKVLADVDGRFRLELPPGEYTLRVWYELYTAQRVQNVRVVAGAVAKIDVALSTDKQAEDVIEVEAEVERASVGAQLLIRKNAAQVGDAIGAQEIARTPDRSASEAARRVVGATVVGNRYVVVRGLGDRYTNSLLNGAPLPSPEPDRQAVPLDLFPTLILSDITILKSFTPDMPGDFAGGSVRINTRELPSKLLAQAQITLGLNSVSTFQDRVSYAGGGLDWLGMDDGTRALPAGFPNYKVTRLAEKPDGTVMSNDELTGHGRQLAQTLGSMETTRTQNLPNGSGNLVLGNTFDLPRGQKLGFTTALSYGRRFTRRPDEVLRTYLPPPTATSDEIGPRNTYVADTGIDTVAWGGFGSATWNSGKDHKVTLTGIYSRASENEGREIAGFNDERNVNVTDTRLRFVERALTFGQLLGEHRFPDLAHATLTWNASASLASSEEPGTRQNVYTQDASTGVYGWEESTLSGSYFFSEQTERSLGAGFDWLQPLGEGELAPKLKLGGLMTLRRRSFDSRRFRFIPFQGQSDGTEEEEEEQQAIFRQSPDQLFTAEYIGTELILREETRNTDTYNADYDVFSGYLMTDAALTRAVRVVVGGRVEASRQTINSFSPYAPELAPVMNELASVTLLPAVSLLYKVTSTSNVRLGLSKTVARPQLRELAPFVFTDYFGAREIVGEPGLTQTSIYNADLRFELFPGTGEVMAVSAFYKQFQDPIEQVIIPSGRGIVSYQNAPGGRNAGIELEMRKTLGFMAPALRDFQLIANLTLVSSRVSLNTDDLGVQTNAVRPLAGQSPYVVNLGLDYAGEETGTRARVLYNVFGPRISQVGSNRLPDVYEEPRHQLDVTFAQRLGQHVDLKLTLENLLDSPVLFTQGEDAEGEANVVNRFRNGVSGALGVVITN
ncbi:TonB-dependent receptor [Chondromyces apiculatus]|uniref:TonB-dependent receptor n=1 Tax=Chondromyces apiculatus DSM 436 TaxID=1192034 RepID=A0A017T5X8_9BACT|nr:TonB-dependent receptor [Chondromyces apiculatus]EYF04604.1 TonB-dependent receptor [Chondromyces apiculatus DSM 436]